MDPNLPFRDTALGRSLLADLGRLAADLPEPFRFMEVCGTHTVSLFRSGVRALLPPNLHHVSGPGCPVCVTHDRELAALITLAGQPDIVLATFGDMVRVPGPDGRSLKLAQAQGAQIAMVYSPLAALDLAASQPEKLVVFAAVGFETTAPTVAATVLAAQKRRIPNFCIFCCHKRVEPALRLLLGGSAAPDVPAVPSSSSSSFPLPAVHGLLLPGHVAAVTGLAPFACIPATGRPAVVAGFEPVDMLAALVLLLRQHIARTPMLTNAYTRVVAPEGNPKALALLEQVFVPTDASWRGLGLIPDGGLRLRPEFVAFDAVSRLGLELPEVAPPRGCRCGDVLRGQIAPSDCPLFGTACTPATPVGPCMVSSEGSCAAWYMYRGE